MRAHLEFFRSRPNLFFFDPAKNQLFFIPPLFFLPIQKFSRGGAGLPRIENNEVLIFFRGGPGGNPPGKQREIPSCFSLLTLFLRGAGGDYPQALDLARASHHEKQVPLDDPPAFRSKNEHHNDVEFFSRCTR